MATTSVALDGEYDLARRSELRHAILDSSATASAVEVDLHGVTFIDSSGLRALLEVRDELSCNGIVMRVTNPSAAADRLLEVTGTGPFLGYDGQQTTTRGSDLLAQLPPGV